MQILETKTSSQRKLRKEWGCLPENFVQVLESLSKLKQFSKLQLQEIEPPKKLAKNSVAIEGIVPGDLATGSFTALYDPSKKKIWGGDTRVVTYLEADISAKEAHDARFADKVWGRFELELSSVQAKAVSGTATISADHYFGEQTISASTSAGIEIRAAWTANSRSLTSDFKVWEKMLLTLAGVQSYKKPALVAL